MYKSIRCWCINVNLIFFSFQNSHVTSKLWELFMSLLQAIEHIHESPSQQKLSWPSPSSKYGYWRPISASAKNEQKICVKTARGEGGGEGLRRQIPDVFLELIATCILPVDVESPVTTFFDNSTIANATSEGKEASKKQRCRRTGCCQLVYGH
jgi:hypothetical protein